MDYPCAKFGDFNFNRFGLTYGQTDRHTESQTRMIAILTRLSNVAISIILDNCFMLKTNDILLRWVTNVFHVAVGYDNNYVNTYIKNSKIQREHTK